MISAYTDVVHDLEKIVCEKSIRESLAEHYIIWSKKLIAYDEESTNPFKAGYTHALMQSMEVMENMLDK
jgi:hypothetical protein